jgi:hypothetical protein
MIASETPTWLIVFLAAIAPMGAIAVAVLGPRVLRQVERAKWLQDNRLSAYMALIDCLTNFRLAQTQLNRSKAAEWKQCRRVIYERYLEVQQACHKVRMLGPAPIARCASDLLDQSRVWMTHAYEVDPDPDTNSKGYQLNLHLKESEGQFLDLAQQQAFKTAR